MDIIGVLAQLHDRTGALRDFGNALSVAFAINLGYSVLGVSRVPAREIENLKLRVFPVFAEDPRFDFHAFERLLKRARKRWDAFANFVRVTVLLWAVSAGICILGLLLISPFYGEYRVSFYQMTLWTIFLCLSVPTGVIAIIVGSLLFRFWARFLVVREARVVISESRRAAIEVHERAAIEISDMLKRK
jgi:hypothetical protein